VTDPASTSLETYLVSRFPSGSDVPDLVLPAADEAHVAWWRTHLARAGGTAESLIAALTQFHIPIGPGAAESEAYVAAIRRGQPVSSPRTAGEVFAAPERIVWTIAEHPAGALPVATFGDRRDFEIAYRALGGRCEPIPVGPDVHALYVSGLPNPVRLRSMRAAFLEAGEPADAWPEEMRRRRAEDPTSFHDRLVLLHPAPYAGIPAAAVGLDEAAWMEASTRLRLEHECTHHATHRLLGEYRLHVHDEVLADLMGFTAALGRFDADLFLRGLGIGDDDAVASDGRLWTYVAELDRGAVPELVRLLRRVADAIAAIAPAFVVESDDVEPQVARVRRGMRLKRLIHLAAFDLPAIAAGEAAPLGIADRGSRDPKGSA